MNSYVYDIANRVTSVDGVAYTWDDNGNLLSDGIYTYTYTSNKLSSITGNNLNIIYQYNGLGERVSQTVNGVPTHFTLDLNAGLSQVLTDGTNTYLYGVGRIAQESTNGVQYFLGDALGSVRQLVDTNGSVILAKDYEPYGEVLNSAGEGASSYGFTGEMHEVTGLVYLRARYYAPRDGRFMSCDLWVGNQSRPMSYNNWLYAYSNPVFYIDPFGLNPCCSKTPAECAVDRIYEIIDGVKPDGAEALFRVFEDLELYNVWGKVAGTTSRDRLIWLLKATNSGGSILPLHFAISFGDDIGFAPEFRDQDFYEKNWGLDKSESNQVGHFLTAVSVSFDMSYELLERATGQSWGVRSDLMLIIGHEKISDQGPTLEVFWNQYWSTTEF